MRFARSMGRRHRRRWLTVWESSASNWSRGERRLKCSSSIAPGKRRLKTDLLCFCPRIREFQNRTGIFKITTQHASLVDDPSLIVGGNVDVNPVRVDGEI